MPGTHSPATSRLVINGILISDLHEDGVTNEPLEEAGAITVRLDGGLTYSFNPTKGRKFMVAVDPTGRGYRDLAEIREYFFGQIAAGVRLPAIPFIYIDPINGTKSVSGVCMFTNRAMAQGGKSLAPVVFEMVVEPTNETHGSLIP